MEMEEVMAIILPMVIIILLRVMTTLKYPISLLV